eukprot:766720-Hanusia_phi.AAC.3
MRKILELDNMTVGQKQFDLVRRQGDDHSEHPKQDSQDQRDIACDIHPFLSPSELDTFPPLLLQTSHVDKRREHKYNAGAQDRSAMKSSVYHLSPEHLTSSLR